MHTTPHRAARVLIGIGVAGVLTLGCGGDDGDLDAFCATLAEAEAADADVATDAQLDELVDSAPDDVSDSIEVVVDVTRDATAAGDDPEAQLEVLDRFEDPEVTDAFAELQTFARDECDLEIDTPTGGAAAAEDDATTTTDP